MKNWVKKPKVEGKMLSDIHGRGNMNLKLPTTAMELF